MSRTARSILVSFGVMLWCAALSSCRDESLSDQEWLANQLPVDWTSAQLDDGEGAQLPHWLEEQSEATPGLIYYSTTEAPKGPHMTPRRFLAAQWQGKRIVLRSPDDLSSLFQRGMRTNDQLAFCIEVIEHIKIGAPAYAEEVVLREGVEFPPLAIQGRRGILGDSLRAALADSTTLWPVVSPTDGVTLHALSFSSLRELTCMIGDNGLSVRQVSADSSTRFWPANP